MTTPKNPPAFPQHVAPVFPQDPGRDGMSLRDYFAGQALAEFASLITVTKPDTLNVVARLSYQMADAMLAARAPQGGE